MWNNNSKEEASFVSTLLTKHQNVFFQSCWELLELNEQISGRKVLILAKKTKSKRNIRSKCPGSTTLGLYFYAECFCVEWSQAIESQKVARKQVFTFPCQLAVVWLLAGYYLLHQLVVAAVAHCLHNVVHLQTEINFFKKTFSKNKDANQQALKSCYMEDLGKKD